jgi:hypothetical protein
LLRVAQEQNLSGKIDEIEATGIYTEWNKQFGEGVFKSWVEGSLIEEKMRTLSLELLKMEQVCTEYRDIPARLLLACRKV